MTTARNIAISLALIPLVLSLSAGESHAGSYTTLTADDVKEVIGAQTAKVRRCYQRYAKRQRQADGTLHVHLQVQPSGKVAKVDVDAPSVRGKRFSRCVSRIAKRWQFPRASGGTDVSYPFLFVHGHTRHARNTSRKHRRRHR